MSNKFIYTTALNKIRKMTKRKKVIQGGSSAGKTFSILPILIDRAIKEPLTDISVIACSIPHLKGGAMKDFIKIMKYTGRFIKSNWNDTNRKYTFLNGSSIEFINADGDKAIGPRRNILYVNEANLITYSTYNQLAIRTDGDIYLDFNPTNTFWVHKEVLTEPDAELLIVNYKDNEALGDTIISELEAKRDKGFNIDGSIRNEYWANWWKVYGLGEVGKLEGVIFDNWKEIDNVPDEAEIIATGIDWGFTNDVTSIVNVYKYNSCILIDEICYQTKLLNKRISDILYENNISWEIYADSAEPKSIEELKQYGHWIRPTQKGADSIIYGISILQSYDILITKRSINIKDEFMRYCWKTDNDGNSLNKPIDAFNHSIDAIRYVAIMKLSKDDSSPLISF